MTQDELGYACDVTNVRICQLENPDTPDAPSARLFRALADALNVDPEQLEVQPCALLPTAGLVFGAPAAESAA